MSANKLPLDKLMFGKTDAFNELKEFGSDWFTQSFLPYEKYKINNFLNGKSYFICGEKGTGKTALLRYLQCELAEDPYNLVIPIRFKTDFDSEDKKSMIRASANIKEVTAEGWDEFQDNADSVKVWQIYILNKFFNIYQTEGAYHFFEDSRELGVIKKLLAVVYPEYKNKIVPKVKRGQLKISAPIMKLLDADLQLELGLDEQSENISFNRIAKSILNRFSHLSYDRNKAYIIFDELELSVRSEKDNKRDVKLVRDLILAIDQLNEICKLNNFDIHIIASVRTEVINSVYSSGYEINKSIEDYGVTISWYQKGGNYQTHPLIKMIENKIIASEEIYGITEHGDIWEKYFPPKINEIDTRKYILSYSWMHPRDVVRLMNQVLHQLNQETIFTQEMFDRALKDYSSASWNEIVEGMSLIYSKDDIKALKLIFTNIEVPFTYQSVVKKIDKLSKIDDRVLKFKEKNNLRKVFDDLFDFGVIGNTGQRMIFKFMDDPDLALSGDMIIHKPLRNFFCVKSRSSDQNME